MFISTRKKETAICFSSKMVMYLCCFERNDLKLFVYDVFVIPLLKNASCYFFAVIIKANSIFHESYKGIINGYVNKQTHRK